MTEKEKINSKKTDAFVIWFTGLSGAGKSTLADRLYHECREHGEAVERLDGDGIRALFPQTGFSKEQRNEHIKRIGHLASLLERNGIIVIASFVSPYREARDFVRGQCHRFIEVYVQASLENCEKRDIKGLYRKARAGEIQQFTGVNDPYEPPEKPEIIISTDHQTPQESYESLKEQLSQLTKISWTI